MFGPEYWGAGYWGEEYWPPISTPDTFHRGGGSGKFIRSFEFDTIESELRLGEWRLRPLVPKRVEVEQDPDRLQLDALSLGLRLGSIAFSIDRVRAKQLLVERRELQMKAISASMDFDRDIVRRIIASRKKGTKS